MDPADLHDSDRTIGQTALRRGYISADQLEEAVRVQAASREAGETVLLGQVLLKRGFIDTRQFIDLMAPRQGATVRRVGRFELEGELGRGGAATVWLATDTLLKRRVALKLLHNPQEPRVLDRLLREVQVIAKLKHPNVVPLHDIGEENGCAYYTMEYVEGKSLADVLEGPPVPREMFLRMFATLLEALHFVHSNGVIHRDLKPANILVDRSGKPYLMDFGTAHLVGGDQKLTATGSIVGTPFYMPPEQVLHGHIDARSDIYAAGVILYQYLTGRLPYRAETELELFQAITEGLAPPPRILDAKIPEPLERICMKAIERDPIHRYAGAHEFAADIERFLRGESLRTTTRPAPVRVLRAFLRHRRASLAALFVLVALAGGIVAVLLYRRVSPPPLATTPDPAPPTRRVEEAFLRLVPAAGPELDLAVYLDPKYPTSWIHDPKRLREFFEARGFKSLDAPSLRAWMEGHLKGDRRGAVVMAQDIAPDTVVAKTDRTCLLRRFLDAGNMILWMGDVPLFYLGRSDGRRDQYDAGPEILGVSNGIWEEAGESLVTAEGARLGVSEATPCHRASPIDEITTALVRCADREDAGWWLKRFGRGVFVRIWDGEFQRATDYDRACAAGLRVLMRGADRLPELKLELPAEIGPAVERLKLRTETGIEADGFVSVDGGRTWVAWARGLVDGAEAPLPRDDVTCERLHLRLEVRRGEEFLGTVTRHVRRVVGPVRVRIESPTSDENLRGRVRVRVAVEAPPGERAVSIRALAGGRVVSVPVDGEWDAEALGDFGTFVLIAEAVTPAGRAIDAVRVRRGAVPFEPPGTGGVRWTFHDRTAYESRKAEWDAALSDVRKIHEALSDMLAAADPSPLHLYVVDKTPFPTIAPTADAVVLESALGSPRKVRGAIAQQLADRMINREVTVYWPDALWRSDALAAVAALEASRRAGVECSWEPGKEPEGAHAFIRELYGQFGWSLFKDAFARLVAKVPDIGYLKEADRWHAVLACLAASGEGVAEVIRAHDGKAGYRLESDRLDRFRRRVEKN